MLDPTYVAACFRCPRTPARPLLRPGPAWPRLAPHGPAWARIPSRCSGPRCPTEAEVRVAVRQGAEEKRNARGFFTPVFTRLTGAPSGPGITHKRLLTRNFTPAPAPRGSGSRIPLRAESGGHVHNSNMKAFEQGGQKSADVDLNGKMR